jgi:hypothetical protein
VIRFYPEVRSRYFLGLPALLPLGLVAFCLIPVLFVVDWKTEYREGLAFFFLPAGFAGAAVGFGLKIACVRPQAGVVPAYRQAHLFWGFVLLVLSIALQSGLGVWLAGYSPRGMVASSILCHAVSFACGCFPSTLFIFATVALISLPLFMLDAYWEDPWFLILAAAAGLGIFYGIGRRLMRAREGDRDFSMPLLDPRRMWGPDGKTGDRGWREALFRRAEARIPGSRVDLNFWERLQLRRRVFPYIGSERWLMLLPVLVFATTLPQSEKSKTGCWACMGLLGMLTATLSFARGFALIPFLTLETVKPCTRETVWNESCFAVLSDSVKMWLWGYFIFLAVLIPAILFIDLNVQAGPMLWCAATFLSLVSVLAGPAGIWIAAFPKPVWRLLLSVAFSGVSVFYFFGLNSTEAWIFGACVPAALIEIALSILLFFRGRHRWMRMDLA